MGSYLQHLAVKEAPQSHLAPISAAQTLTQAQRPRRKRSEQPLVPQLLDCVGRRRELIVHGGATQKVLTRSPP